MHLRLMQSHNSWMTEGSYKLLGISERLGCNTWCIMNVIWTFSYASNVNCGGCPSSKSDSSHMLAWRKVLWEISWDWIMSVFKFIAFNDSAKTAMCYILSLCSTWFSATKSCSSRWPLILSKTMNSVQLKVVAICLLHILIAGLSEDKIHL